MQFSKLKRRISVITFALLLLLSFSLTVPGYAQMQYYVIGHENTSAVHNSYGIPMAITMS